MEENLSMQRHNALENATINYLNQFGDTNKLNASVLREHDGNSLQFITIPRATETDYVNIQMTFNRNLSSIQSKFIYFNCSFSFHAEFVITRFNRSTITKWFNRRCYPNTTA